MATDMHDNAPPPARPGRQTALRRLAWSAGFIAGLVVLVVASILVAASTESGTRLLWQAAGKALSGRLSGEWAGGTLSHGMKLRNVAYRDATRQVQIDRLEARWQLLRAPLTLNVQFLRIGRADITLLPSPPQPRKAPQQLTLPLAFNLNSATVDQLVMHQAATATRYRDLRLQARSDGVQHALTLEKALTPAGTARASLRLNGLAPFALNANGQLQGALREKNYRVEGRLSGTLQALQVQLNAVGDMLNGQATVDAAPFDPVPLRRAHIDLRHLDPSVFNVQWPRADLRLQARLAPVNAAVKELAELVVAGPVSISNARPGALDQGALPLLSANLEVKLDARTQQLTQAKIALLGDAVLQGSGQLRESEGRLALQADGLDLHALHSKLTRSALTGPFAWRVAGDRQYLDLKLSDQTLAIAAAAELDAQQISLRSARLQAGAAILELRGTLGRAAPAAYALSGKLTDFNPALFLSSIQAAQSTGTAARQKRTPRIRNMHARINTDFDAQGMLRPELSAKVRLNVYDSTYANLPMTGGGMLQLVGKRLLPSNLRLSIAGNELRLNGSFGAPSDRMVVHVDAPALDRLGLGVSGLLRIDAQLNGTLTHPLVRAQVRAENLIAGSHRVARLSGEAHTTGAPGTPDARADFKLTARDLHSSGIFLSRLEGSIDGTYGRHTLRAEALGRLRGKPLQVALNAQGRLQELQQGMAWDGVVRTLESRGIIPIALTAPLPLHVAPGRVELGAGRLTIAQASIALKNFGYDQGRVHSEGEVSALDIGQLLALQQQLTGTTAPLSTDLVLDGRWNFAIDDRATGFMRIERRRGDIRVRGESALGLTALSLNATLQGSQVALKAQANAARIGTASADGQLTLQRADGRLVLASDSPLSGRLSASIPRLHTIAALAGPRIALSGNAGIDLAVAGTVSQPIVSGTLNGNQLALTLYDQGIRLQDGIARIRLENNIAELQQVEFRGGEGTLRATGRIPLQPAALDAQSNALTAAITAERLQLLASPSGQMTISGQARVAQVAQRLQVTGSFNVDRALFSLPEKSAPKLGDDVVVVRGGKTQRATSGRSAAAERPAGLWTPAVQIEVGLGNDFYFKGSGADVRLAGLVTVHSEPGEPPQAYGTVRLAEGSVEAFGTKLVIERGVINFQGALQNPNLNILAMRREQEVAVGVQVSGNVRQPRVQLVSEPDLPQEEKLSWLVFGNGGGADQPRQAQTAVKGAALGLLNKFGGERLAKGFGLDVLSIGESEFGLSGTQVVNLGKEISDRLFIGYEQSLAGAESVLKLTYELTQHWSVVLRGGDVTGLEMFYSKRFDTLR